MVRSGEAVSNSDLGRWLRIVSWGAQNRPLEDWGKLLGGVPSAAAILDRFLHHAEIISITGRSCRLKDRAEKDRGEKEPASKEKAAGSRAVFSSQVQAAAGPGRPAAARVFA